MHSYLDSALVSGEYRNVSNLLACIGAPQSVFSDLERLIAHRNTSTFRAEYRQFLSAVNSIPFNLAEGHARTNVLIGSHLDPRPYSNERTNWF